MPRQFDLTTHCQRDLIQPVNKALPDGIVLDQITQTLGQKLSKAVTLHFTVDALLFGVLPRKQHERIQVSMELLKHTDPTTLAGGFAAELLE